MSDVAEPTAADELSPRATRVESDSMGAVDVPADRYWGAQTQRSLHHFTVTGEVMPLAIIHALAMVKVAAARTNARLGVLDPAVSGFIESAADEVINGALDGEFPLTVFQTGSGTQTNMNVNEVIANRAIELAGGERGSKQPVHPNDHVNASQSSNDVFPTAANVAVALALRDQLLPSLVSLRDALAERSERWADVVKIGRTHLQDAVPLTVGQEWSGYAAQLTAGIDAVERAMDSVLDLAIGGTAVGTGLNAPDGFGAAVAEELSARTGLAFRQAPNLFAALAGAEGLTAVSGALRQCASSLFKIGNDLRWLGSGPRAGLGELVLPANEPGSSIMPGKVNPTQCEALLMACVQVLGNDTTVGIAASQGNFELNVMRPLMAANVLRSIALLAATTTDFRAFLVDGVELNLARIDELVGRSLMLVTALSPAIGYDAAAAIAHDAHERDVSLRDAALASGLISADDFDRIVDPSSMT